MFRAFVAAATAATELCDFDTFAVVLSERKDGGARLEIQVQLSPPGVQERDLGMDTYCLCTETGAVYYGGITSWKFHDTVQEILLDEGARAVLGVEGYHISVAQPDVSVIREGIKRVVRFVGSARTN